MSLKKCILFGIFSVLILLQFLFEPNIIIKNDLNGNIVPLIYFKDSIINHLQFPLWNPFINQGIPAVADPLYGIYNPLISIPLLLLPYQAAIKVTYLLAVFLACISMYALLKRYKISENISVIIALTYASNSYLFSRINAGHLEKVVSFAFLPLFFYCIIKSIRNKNLLWSGTTSIVLALILFSGDIYNTLYFLYSLALITVYYFLKDRKIPYYLISTLILFLLFSSIKLLPMLELQSYIYKIKEPFVGGQNILSIFYYLFLPFNSLYEHILPVQFFLPNDFGWWENYSFIGPFSIIGLLYLFKNKSKQYKNEIGMYVLLIVFFVLLSMPGAWFNPMSLIISKIGLLQYFHVPSRVFILLGIVFLLFLGLYLEKLKKRNLAIFLLLINLFITLIFSQDILSTKKFDSLKKDYNSSIDWIANNNKNNYYVVHEISQGDLPQDKILLKNLLLLQSNYGFFLRDSPGEKYNFRGNSIYNDIQPGFIISNNIINNSELKKVKTFKNNIIIYKNLSALAFAQINSIPKNSEILVNKISITNVSKIPEKLIILESKYPGWKAYADGKEINLLNSRFLQINTLKGAHKYEFIYSSISFIIGFLISSFSLTIFGIYVFQKSRKKYFL